MSAVEIVGVKFCCAHVKTLEMTMRKLVLGVTVEILLEKIHNIIFKNNLRFIHVNQTVTMIYTKNEFHMHQIHYSLIFHQFFSF